MQVLLVETDSISGATYFTLRDEPVAGTAEVGDSVMVDVDEHGDPIGVEFPFGQPADGAPAWHSLVGKFPSLKEAFYPHL